MLSAERAILLDLEALGHILLVFHRIVVPALAFCTSQSNPCSHDFHLHFSCFQGKKKDLPANVTSKL
jgi:hypothetical protein